MRLDVPKILSALAKRRPVFHSEADFRLELILQIHKMHPKLCPVAEYPIRRESKEAYDLVLFRGHREVTALELKYVCQKLDYRNEGQTFKLKASTTDAGRYGTLRDIERMEEFLEKIRKKEPRRVHADVITLTNDPFLWEGQKRTGVVGEEFNIADSVTRDNRKIKNIVSGTLRWLPRTATKTKRACPKIRLHGRYRMMWRDYSKVAGKFGQFRYLHIPVQPPKS